MNEQEILDFNKICAEFLGAKLTDLGGAQKAIYYPILGGSHYAHKLKFHSDCTYYYDNYIPYPDCKKCKKDTL